MNDFIIEFENGGYLDKDNRKTNNKELAQKFYNSFGAQSRINRLGLLAYPIKTKQRRGR